MKLSLPSPSMAVSITALVVALGGTSYAAVTITGANIKNNSVTGADVKNSSLTGSDIKNRSLTSADFKKGQLPAGPAGKNGSNGANGAVGPKGDKGDTGPAGAGRWVLIDALGNIEGQSGGFSVPAAYPILGPGPNGTDPNGLRASGNVYINANEPLDDNAIVTTIALQNQRDQNGDGNMNGRGAPVMGVANPEFSGEISATRCGIMGIVACAPMGTNNANHFVVSPRMSDGTVTTPPDPNVAGDIGTRKRFYVIITGDSTDFVAPAAG